MYLTSEQVQRIVAHINARWRQPGCQLCGANDWVFQGYLSTTLTPNPATVVGGGAHMPTAAAICRNCGNTVLLNLVVMGVVDAS